MILVDTSVWVDHLRYGNARLGHLLIDGEATIHPFVMGELACGHLTKRSEILSLLKTLPSLEVAQDDEVLRLIESHKLFGRGLGWVDVHLLTSAVLAQLPIWSLDKALMRSASTIGLST